MGCCVGEKNRALFYLYLVVQAAELAVAVIIVEKVMAFQFIHYAIAIIFVLVIVLAILICCLLSFHTYLMLKGLTTW